MVHYLLVLLALQPSCLTAVHSVHRIRPLRHPAVYCFLTLGTMDLLWLLNQLVLPKPNLLISFLILFSGFFYLPFFAQKGHRLQAMLAHGLIMTMTLVVVVIVEHIVLTAAAVWGVQWRITDMSDPAYLIMILINACIIIPLLVITCRFLQRVAVPDSSTLRLLWFLIIPLSQTVLLFMVNRHLQHDNSLTIWGFLLSGALLCIAADFACILGYRKSHELQIMEDQVREAEHQLNTQNEYYREMQENILTINQIRHDLNNQLKTAYYLLEQGHPEEVRKQLDTLSSCVQNRVGTRYCENMLVDAVLREEAAHCEKEGIPLELSVLVPADLKIDSAHLCSAFSNLLDNAIAAAKKAGPHSGPIKLRSDIHKGYLMIACSNPSVVPSRVNRTDILRRHGLGLEILGKLANIHDGSFETDFHDGRFYVTLMMKNA